MNRVNQGGKGSNIGVMFGIELKDFTGSANSSSKIEKRPKLHIVKSQRKTDFKWSFIGLLLFLTDFCPILRLCDADRLLCGYYNEHKLRTQLYALLPISDLMR